MKLRTVFLIPCIIAIAACNNSSKNSNGVVQHDTIKANKIVSAGTADEIIENGEYIKHYKNGVIEMRGIMKDGKRDGVWKTWYESGLPWSETEFKDGKKTGKTTTWYDNGKKRYEGFYADDKETGKWVYWDETGKEVK